MKVRFKHFLRGDIDHGNWQGDQMGSGDPGLFDPPPRVMETQDGEGTLEDVRAWIRKGALTPDDLIDLGRGWQSANDAPELEEAVAAAPRPKRRKPWGLVAFLATWAAGLGAIPTFQLGRGAAALLAFGIPSAFLMAWALRRDIVRTSPTVGALPTVTENVFEKPSEAEPGSVSIASPEHVGEGGAVSLSQVAAPPEEAEAARRDKERS